MSNLYFNNVEKVGQLYLEYVFFEFESEPILFICHDQLNQTYLCLCSDIRHGQKWIITKCDTKILRALYCDCLFKTSKSNSYRYGYGRNGKKL